MNICPEKPFILSVSLIVMFLLPIILSESFLGSICDIFNKNQADLYQCKVSIQGKPAVKGCRAT